MSTPVQNHLAVTAREPLPAPARVRRRTNGRAVVLHVIGEVDLASVEILRSEIRAALESGAAELWIDLCDTAFMDSSGLHAVVEADREVRRRDQRLTIICPPGPVRRVFELARLDKALALHDDAESLLRCAR